MIEKKKLLKTYIDEIVELPEEKLIPNSYVSTAPDDTARRCIVGHMLNEYGIERILIMQRNKEPVRFAKLELCMFKERFQEVCGDVNLLGRLQVCFDSHFPMLLEGQISKDYFRLILKKSLDNFEKDYYYY